MKPNALVTMGVLAGLLLAGCTDGEHDSGALQSIGGVVEGRVLDDTYLPVADARVRILLTDLETTTDRFGAFAIQEVPAGPVRVVASKEGHASSTRSASLADGGRLAFEFVLASAPRVEGFVDVKRFDGTIACGFPGGVDCSAVQAQADQNTTHRYEVASGLVAVVLEMEWTPPVEGASEELAFDVHSATASRCGAKYQGAVGQSVLRLEVDEGFPISGGHECVVAKATADAATMQQDYTLFVSLFYHEAPEAGYSALATGA